MKVPIRTWYHITVITFDDDDDVHQGCTKGPPLFQFQSNKQLYQKTA